MQATFDRPLLEVSLPTFMKAAGGTSSGSTVSADGHPYAPPCSPANSDLVKDLGDWGKQYGLLALAYEKYGDEAALKRDPIDHLFKLYVRINAEKEAEKEQIEAQKKEGKDVAGLESDSLDEQARQYFRKMVRHHPIPCLDLQSG